MLGAKHGIANIFLGLMKSWVLNVGEGSYKEGAYNEGEQAQLNFGFESGAAHLKFKGQDQAYDEVDSSAE